MSEHISGRYAAKNTLLLSLKKDAREATKLYFAPVTAVARVIVKNMRPDKGVSAPKRIPRRSA